VARVRPPLLEGGNGKQEGERKGGKGASSRKKGEKGGAAGAEAWPAPKRKGRMDFSKGEGFHENLGPKTYYQRRVPGTRNQGRGGSHATAVERKELKGVVSSGKDYNLPSRQDNIASLRKTNEKGSLAFREGERVKGEGHQGFSKKRRDSRGRATVYAGECN